PATIPPTPESQRIFSYVTQIFYYGCEVRFSYFHSMDIHEIKNRLVKKATSLTIGSFKPTGSDKESWIGRVSFYKEEEGIPEETVGLPMLPLLQLSLEGLPFVPEGLENTKMLTVFISEDLPTGLADNGDDWVLREYSKDD